jgi:hypothetical protein
MTEASGTKAARALLQSIAEEAEMQSADALSWAQVLHVCLERASEHSPYGGDWRIGSLTTSLEREVYPHYDGVPLGSGLTATDLRDAHAELAAVYGDREEAKGHELILAWRSRADGQVQDWSVPPWHDLLRRLGVEPEMFLARNAWPAAEAQRMEPIEWRRELDALVGLRAVKEQVNELRDLLYLQRLRMRRRLPGVEPVELSMHQIFKGNPGTGKTTVARILGAIYREYGLLKSGHVVSVQRSDLVGAVIGKTEQLTKDWIEKAHDGVLFIDEAYSLAGGGPQDFGPRAIDTLLTEMEDRRKALVVIVAGYPRKMEEFLDSNPGLASRFSDEIRFEDYSDEELLEIFRRTMFRHGMTSPSEALVARVLAWLVARREGAGERFGNARDVRNLGHLMFRRQARRLAIAYGGLDPPETEWDGFQPEDVPAVAASAGTWTSEEYGGKHAAARGLVEAVTTSRSDHRRVQTRTG